MFSAKDIRLIDTEYFNTELFSGYHIIIMSKNTHHIWDIYSPGEYKNCQIFHKHSSEAAYHFHSRAKNLRQAIKDIKSHDEFQLNVRKK